MPPRKRSNWRQPTVFDHPDGGGRRTTRAARQSAGQSRGSSSQYATRDGVTVNVTRSKERVQGWIEVWRPPAPGVGFAVPIWIQIDKLTPEEREAYLPSTDAKPEEEGELQDQAETTTEKSIDDTAAPMENSAEPMQIDTPEKTNVNAEITPQPATTSGTSGETTLIDGPKSESGVPPQEKENIALSETPAASSEAPNETTMETSAAVPESNPTNDTTTETPGAATNADDDIPVKAVASEEVTQTAPGDSSQSSESNEPKANTESENAVMGKTKEGEAPPAASAIGESSVAEELAPADPQGTNSTPVTAPAGTTEPQTQATDESLADAGKPGFDTNTDTVEEPEAKRQRVEGPDSTST